MASVADPSPCFETFNLNVAYGEHQAIRGVDLRIERQKITAIVGPSGCGKSTFLTTLNRLTDLVPACRVTGSILLDGVDILGRGFDVLGLRRRVGMVFQKPNPFPLSIRRNLSLPLREHRFPTHEIDALIETTLREVSLWKEVKDRLDAPALSLSGGQQQRLCIARALALRPEVLLFDEPCSALDPLSSSVVERLIVSLRSKVTVVIVTHNLAQARRIADQLAVFWHQNGSGKVLDQGAANRVLEAPADSIVAEYLHGTRG